MFCKWCGADFPNGARTCKRCGKEVPAKSDCGGFYDLVPKAKVVPIPEKKEPENKTAPQAPKEKTINANPVLILLCIILAAAVVLLLVTGNDSESGDSKRDRDRDSSSLLDGIISDDDSTKPGDQNEDQSTETDEATAPSEEKLVEQAIQLEIQMTDEGPELTEDMDFYTATVINEKTEYDTEGRITGLPILVNEKEAVWISINREDNKIGITVDDALLETDEELTYTWEVSVDDGEKWDALKTEKNPLTAVYEGKIKKLKQIAFRLTYKKAAQQGEEAETVGSLTVSIPASLLGYEKAE